MCAGWTTESALHLVVNTCFADSLDRRALSDDRQPDQRGDKFLCLIVDTANRPQEK